MDIDARIQSALMSSDPLAELRSLIKCLLSQGRTPEGVLKLFEEARQQLRSAGREADEDVVMDAMDFLTGWCSPQMKLPTDKTA
jgi:hypothetical protein